MGNRTYKKFVCEFCGDEFITRSDNKARFCSLQCFGKYRSATERQYTECPICGKTFRKKRSSTVYCSNECASKGRTSRVTITCDNCGGEITRPPCHISEHNFCSIDCRNEWTSKNKYGENAVAWKGGIYKPQTGYIFLRNEDGSYKAEHRIVAEQKIGRKLMPDEVVHHIDGNKANNAPENLEVMTRAEHARLHGKIHNNLCSSHSDALRFGVQTVTVEVFDG